MFENDLIRGSWRNSEVCLVHHQIDPVVKAHRTIRHEEKVARRELRLLLVDLEV